MIYLIICFIYCCIGSILCYITNTISSMFSSYDIELFIIT